jgi:hypothetical protein
MRRGANFSRCRRYRYNLWREWEPLKPRVLFIALNPSTADDRVDDPTIRRCIGYARDWGFGGLNVANLFAFRATHPADLKAADDPVGPRNDWWLRKLSAEAELVVAGWGNHGRFMNRADAVRHHLESIHCLKMNRSGEPAHPLYLRKSLRPRLMTG